MNQKYVIFDLDETLGFFTELSIIWDCLKKHQGVTGQRCFDELCLLFESCIFRPGIFDVLNVLKTRKKSVKIILYTNNNGGKEWLNHIITFMERRVNKRGFFDKIVPGYNPKLKGKNDRTTYNKTYSEIIRCADIPPNAKIIFFDDLIHQGMKHKNVNYVHLHPYCFPLKSTYIINKLQKSFFGFINYSNILYLQQCIHQYHVNYAHHLLEKRNTNVYDSDIFIPLMKFLNASGEKQKTKKNKKYSRNKTRKHRRSHPRSVSSLDT